MNDCFDKLDDKRMHILPKANEIMEEHSVEVFHAMDNVFSVMNTVEYKGLSAISSIVKQFQKNGDSREKAFGKCLEIICDNPFDSPDVFIELFEKVCLNQVDEYISYIYLRCILLVVSFADRKIWEKIMLSLLPGNYRGNYRNILQKR